MLVPRAARDHLSHPAVPALLDSGPVPDAPFPREGHGLTYDSARHCLVVFGGSTPDSEPRDLWEWHR